MDFRDRLFDLRRQAGLSQEELANLMGVTRQAVQKWEAGTSRPDMDNLVSLADYFKVSLDYLATGKEAASPPATTIVNNYYHDRPEHWHYEYKSRRTLFGLPLVHVNCGFGRDHWARGIIAIGNVATGFVALGGVSVGLFTLGGVSLGLLLALGAVSAGAVSIGGVAIGLLAWGGIAMGWLAVGGCAAGGAYAAGGVVAANEVAVGGCAAGALAIGAKADGVQTILVPREGLMGAELEAARAAIDAACAGAPGFVPWLLKLFLL